MDFVGLVLMVCVKVLEADPLYVMTSEEKTKLWAYRNFVKTNFPSFLPKVLLSADWASRSHVTEVIFLLSLFSFELFFFTI